MLITCLAIGALLLIGIIYIGARQTIRCMREDDARDESEGLS